MRETNYPVTNLLYACLLLWLAGCEPESVPERAAFPIPEKENIDLSKAYAPLLRNGKTVGHPPQQELFQTFPLDSVDFPIIDGRLITGLQGQQTLLKRRIARRSRRIGNLTVLRRQLEETVRILQYWQHTKPLGISQYLEAHQIWGEDRRGNVQFTGYFTPVLPVRENPVGAYQYPLYSRPLDWEGPLPSRAQIEGNKVLAGRGLELAYASNKVDIYYMQVQGSGYVVYPDGRREMLAYNGTNRHPYHSIEKYIANREDIQLPNLSIAGIRHYLDIHPEMADTILFQNPSYTFFTPRQHEPTGAGTVPLQPGISVAVDRNYLPLGSCLLAAVPVFDHQTQRVIRHDFQILLAQDVGGAIRGPGHIDLYFGTGPEALRKASIFKHYGRIWLLLPKHLPMAVPTTN